MASRNRTLLDDWILLKEWVVPALMRPRRGQGPPRAWAIGDLADGVAIAAAYQDAAGKRSSRLSAFVSERTGPQYFTLSEIRAIPGVARFSSFRRSDHGWIPTDDIARRISLAEPDQPVDVIAVGAESTYGPPFNRASRMLKEGGLLVLSDPCPGAGDLPGLREVDGRSQVFEKESPAAPPPAPKKPRAVETLAQKQYQDELVTSHANLARSLAHRFSGHGEQREDLEQVALLALVKAAKRFDPERGISFSTFATATIAGELKRHFRDNTWMMRVPRSIQENYLAVKNAREELGHELSRSPTIQEIAARLNVTDEVVLEAMEAGENYWPDSLDVGLREGDAGRDVGVIDPSYDLMIDHQDLQRLLPRLDRREQTVLCRLFFDGCTQRQVAEELSVSQMQISRLLSRTLQKLRTA